MIKTKLERVLKTKKLCFSEDKLEQQPMGKMAFTSCLVYLQDIPQTEI